jgi:hypothetical protein
MNTVQSYASSSVDCAKEVGLVVKIQCNSEQTHDKGRTNVEIVKSIKTHCRLTTTLSLISPHVSDSLPCFSCKGNHASVLDLRVLRLRWRWPMKVDGPITLWSQTVTAIFTTAILPIFIIWIVHSVPFNPKYLIPYGVEWLLFHFGFKLLGAYFNFYVWIRRSIRIFRNKISSLNTLVLISTEKQ